MSNRRSALLLIFITFVAFISLGSPDGLLDIANPRIRDSFSIGTDIFSLIFLTGLTGYFLSSFFAGQLVAWMGIGRLLAASCAATAVALLGSASSPSWGWFVALGLLGGAGAGAIDSGLNTYVATNFGPRLMFWLHASFGLGVTGGTALMSLVVNSGESWRLGYVMVGVFQLTLAAIFFIMRERFNNPHADTNRPAAEQISTPIRSTLRIPVVWIGIALFFLYTGGEVIAGRWSSSLFIEGRHINSETAGLWVSIYWGMFTVGRIAASFVGRWLTPLGLIRLSMGGSLLAALLLVVNPASWTGGVALGLMGLTFAPIFPILISVTPQRVGPAHTANTIGFQVGAAAIGGSLLPGLTGVLAQATSIKVQPFMLLFVTLAMLTLHELSQRSLATQPAPEAGVPTPEPAIARAAGDR